MPLGASGCACCGGALGGLFAAAARAGAWKKAPGPQIGRRGFVAAAVRDAAGPGATRVDLAGRTMLPGFVDPHTHAIAGAVLDGIAENVGASRFRTAAEVLERLRALVAAVRSGEWVLARNFDPSLQDGPAALTFAELDAVSAEVPVFVMNASGHLAYANRAAFRAAGIPEDVANPPGAELVRDAAGRLTGEMKNVVAVSRVASAARGASRPRASASPCTPTSR